MAKDDDMVRTSIRFLFPLMALACCTSAGAQDFPTKPVRGVVPYAAGGLPDTMTRLAAVKMTEIFG